MATLHINPQINAYLLKASPFAQPILTHLRELVHKGCPSVEEEIKWGRPFFVYRGAVLCNMAAFKEHCSFGFWGKEIGALLREANALHPDGMGSFGPIKSLKDLPSDKQMLTWIRKAAAFVDSGEYTSPMAARRKVAKAEIPLPAEFAAALDQNQQTALAFAAMNLSCRREYIEWISDAKRPETRDKRIATAVEWISQGKQRNWKYQS